MEFAGDTKCKDDTVTALLPDIVFTVYVCNEEYDFLFLIWVTMGTVVVLTVISFMRTKAAPSRRWLTMAIVIDYHHHYQGFFHWQNHTM